MKTRITLYALICALCIPCALAECAIQGDSEPCGEVTLSEVIAYINQWVSGQAPLSGVITLINAWAAPAQAFELTSSDFTDGGDIPVKYTCDGQDINPQLTISGTPASTEEFALIFYDLDAVGGWDHWVMWNIPLASSIPEDSVPSGAVQGQNSWEENRYGGPCPPYGETHRYVFKLYALNDSITLSTSSGKTALENAMSGHIIQQANITCRYGA